MTLPLGGPKAPYCHEEPRCWANPYIKEDGDILTSSPYHVCNNPVPDDDETMLCSDHRASILGEVQSAHELPALLAGEMVA